MRPFHFVIGMDGKLPIGIRESLQRIIPTFAGKKMVLILQEAKDKRNNDQNSFYWAAIIPHVRLYKLEQGDAMSEDDVHEELLTIFAPREERIDLNGDTYLAIVRSSKMTVEQFSTYCTAIIAKMAEFGSPVPVRDNI